mmetsp:Transcript_439/g.632  ORF Transcript_439/g.632 Transcript_439/m.632 type:complete len:577 (+) Transcript_439:68-1798(+)
MAGMIETLPHELLSKIFEFAATEIVVRRGLPKQTKRVEMHSYCGSYDPVSSWTCRSSFGRDYIFIALVSKKFKAAYEIEMERIYDAECDAAAEAATADDAESFHTSDTYTTSEESLYEKLDDVLRDSNDCEWNHEEEKESGEEQQYVFELNGRHETDSRTCSYDENPENDFIVTCTSYQSALASLSRAEMFLDWETDEETLFEFAFAASMLGKHEILQLMHDNELIQPKMERVRMWHRKLLQPPQLDTGNNTTVHEGDALLLAHVAIFCGQLDTVKWFHENKYALDYNYMRWRKENMASYKIAAYSGNLPTIKFLKEMNPQMYHCQRTKPLLEAASMSGSLETLQWLHKDRGSLPLYGCDSIVESASKVNNIEMLKFLHYHNYCEMTETALYHAVSHNNLEMVQWLLKSGVGIGLKRRSIIVLARTNRNYDIMQILHEKGYNFNIVCFSEKAVKKYDYKFLKWLKGIDCPFQLSSLRLAIKRGDVDMLKILKDMKGCEYDTKVSFYATFKGNLEVVKLLHDTGCAFDCRSSQIAAKHRDVELLKFLYDNNCPLDYAATKVYKELTTSKKRKRPISK